MDAYPVGPNGTSSATPPPSRHSKSNSIASTSLPSATTEAVGNGNDTGLIAFSPAPLLHNASSSSYSAPQPPPLPFMLLTLILGVAGHML